MRPKTITITPILADTDALATKQVPAASGPLIMTGTQVAGADRDGVVPAFAATAAMELVSHTIEFKVPQRISIYSTSDESGDTFTIRGRGRSGEYLTEDISGPNNTTVYGSTIFNAVLGARVDGALTSAGVEIGNAGYAELSQPQHISITASGDEAPGTFTIYGEDRFGNRITETLAGPNADTASSVNNFKRVFSVLHSSGTVTTVQVGIGNALESQWIPVERSLAQTTIDCILSSSADFDYQVDWTVEDVQSADFSETTCANHTVTDIASTDVSKYGIHTHPVSAFRAAISSFASGSMDMTIIQSEG